MKKLFDILLLAGIVSLFIGCYKDKGNYDYSEINQVKFDGFPTELQYAYANVDTIRVSPTIKGSIEDDNLDNYSFRWQAVVKSGMVDNKTTFDLDSNRLDLDYFVQLPIADYTVYLLVEDKTSGVTWRQGFDLKVTSAMNEGWLILSEVGGTCRLDMISTSTAEEKLVKNIWGQSVLAARKGPRAIAQWADMMSGVPPVYLLSDEGAVKLNPDDFSYDYLNELEYEFGKWDENFVPTCMKGNYSNMWRICVGEDGIYAKDDMTTGAIYGIRLNKLKDEDEYFGVAPAIGLSADPFSYEPAIILYDTTNQRFIQLDANLQGVHQPTSPETYFAWKTGMKFVYMTGTLHDGGEVFTILKDLSDNCWLYGIKASNFGALSQVSGHYFQIDAPEIDKATVFAVHPVLYYLFYAVDNKIYQYDITSGQYRVLDIHTLGGETTNSLRNEKISMLKFNTFILGDYSKPAGSTQMQYRLIVGSEKSDVDLGGCVRMLEIPTSLDAPASVYREYKGFGKVIDVVYRERK